MDWVISILSLIGMYFVINKNKKGFIILFIANTSWIIFYLTNSIYGSAFLFLAFDVQVIYGFLKWKKEVNYENQVRKHECKRDKKGRRDT